MYENKGTSYLYHLEPIGIGTPYIESLLSYIKRLAEAHCLSTSKLFNREILEDMNRNYLCSSKFNDGLLPLLSISSRLAKDVVEVLEKKTLNKNLSLLALQQWGGFLRSGCTFRKHHAWCPICYYENLKKNGTVYEQLIWSIKEVSICKIHNIKLVEKCPYCGNPVDIFGAALRVGFCNKCNHWLGLSKNEYNPKSDIILDWDIWSYDNIGYLLATSPNKNDSTFFSRNISNYIHNNGLTKSSFANMLGVSFNKVRYWVSNCKPGVSDALQLSYILKTNIVDILQNSVCFQETNTIEEFTKMKFNKKKRINYDLIERSLKQILNSSTKLSLHNFAKKMGVNQEAIDRHFPEECAVLKEEYCENIKIDKSNKS